MNPWFHLHWVCGTMFCPRQKSGKAWGADSKLHGSVHTFSSSHLCMASMKAFNCLPLSVWMRTAICVARSKKSATRSMSCSWLQTPPSKLATVIAIYLSSCHKPFELSFHCLFANYKKKVWMILEGMQSTLMIAKIS